MAATACRQAAALPGCEPRPTNSTQLPSPTVVITHMRKPRIFHLASLALGLLCATFLVWLWRQSFVQPTSVTRPRPDTVQHSPVLTTDAASAPEAITTDPFTLALLAALQRAISGAD